MEHKILITGGNGFIGFRLAREFMHRGIMPVSYTEDLRRPIHTKDRPDFVFHFGSPSSQVLFNRNPDYCIDSTINGFLNVLDFCRHTGAKLIYPSTGLISSGNHNEYSMCKYLIEKLAEKSGIPTLGLRIFATYGPGEEHKLDYKSVVSLFYEDIIEDIQPVVFGDGTQKRDFIYISDVVRRIMEVYKTDTGIMEIGSGVSYSFNEVIKTINKVTSKNIEPKYVDKPINYVEKTVCSDPVCSPTDLQGGVILLELNRS